tara:strand:- start:1141 stop:1584 length:444 start_codon:yes stop_codon:yes gene_type:complete
MTLDEFQIKFLKFAEESVEPLKDDGYPVCPYAKSARIKKALQFVDARDNVLALESFDHVKYQMAICWLGDVDDMSSIEKTCEELREKHSHLLYFTSTRTSGNFVKNFTDCVFIQRKSDLLEKRKHLHENTTYYDSWPVDYYNLIMGH